MFIITYDSLTTFVLAVSVICSFLDTLLYVIKAVFYNVNGLINH